MTAPQQPAPTDGELILALMEAAVAKGIQVVGGKVTGESEDDVSLRLGLAHKDLATRLASLAQQVEDANSNYQNMLEAYSGLAELRKKEAGERDALREALGAFYRTTGICTSQGQRPTRDHFSDVMRSAKAALALPAPTTEGGDR